MSISQRTIDINGLSVEEFVINNDSRNIVLSMVSYGATITSCVVGDGQKNEEVTLCYPLERLINDPGPYFGATVGRVANRTCEGKFSLASTDGGQAKAYTLAVNNGENHLHGGLVGFDKKIWDYELVDSEDEIGVKFKCDSPHGEEGYPGNVSVEATYVLSRKSSEIIITFRANTDHLTPINLTNHTYWNLSGDLTRDIKGHALYLNCDHYLPVTSTQIPTGEYAVVKGTDFDFTSTIASPSAPNSLPVPPLHKYSVEISPPQSSVTENKQDTTDLTPEELAKETDAEFIARMEREEAVAFAQAVENWRMERANGGGQAVIMETGGDFVKESEKELVCKEGTDVLPARLLDDVINKIDGGGEPGLDHCFLVNEYEHPDYDLSLSVKADAVGERMRTAAVVYDSTSGRRMVCSTTQPGVQIYTANWLAKGDSDSEAHDYPFTQHNAICLETQGLPDAVNQLHFPSVLLHPDKTYKHKTKYSFFCDSKT
mmetsp:Transcript_37826/g.70502  ORF Transcript_37826/g.70502 Transcript_37826/m.70502 type:complete len:487 (-) Transcript_37826:151-1611(-)